MTRWGSPALAWLLLPATAAVILVLSCTGSDSGCENDLDCSGDRVCEDHRCVAPREGVCETDDDCPLPDVCVDNMCTPPCNRQSDCGRSEICVKRPNPGHDRVCQKANECEDPSLEQMDDSCRWTWSCTEGNFAVECVFVAPDAGVYECRCVGADDMAQEEPVYAVDLTELCGDDFPRGVWGFATDAVDGCGWLLPAPP